MEVVHIEVDIPYKQQTHFGSEQVIFHFLIDRSLDHKSEDYIASIVEMFVDTVVVVKVVRIVNYIDSSIVAIVVVVPVVGVDSRATEFVVVEMDMKEEGQVVAVLVVVVPVDVTE